MKLEDAAKVLNLTGELTPEIIKKAYRIACSKYHPDKGGSLQMMQAVNEAYEDIKDFTGNINNDSEGDYSELLNDAINAIITLDNITIEICGAWVWVPGDTKPHAKALGKNGAGFYYASKKQAWYYRPADWKSTSRGKYTLDDIRDRHGSQGIKIRKPKTLASV